MKINEADRGAILAGLALLCDRWTRLPPVIQDILSDGLTFVPLTKRQIETLSEKINSVHVDGLE